ncbi:MAG: hypothetical protein OEV00_10465 [Acidobacteriota bacterium]|nr:hypothetical protein [Acidobacteriota bacterium]MDH3785734.1 hypothetical protein [Acidobacteriota bacterium]
MEILALGLLLLTAGLVMAGMLVVGFFKLLIFLVVLPFRLLGALLSGVGSLASGLATVLFSIVVLVALVVAVPLVPLLLLAAAAYLIFRLMRPRRAAAA